MIRLKFFLDPIKDVSQYVNQMSEKGYRLKGIHYFIYQFEASREHYHYSSQYIGGNSAEENAAYLAMLAECDQYQLFRAPINQGSINFFKFRWRPLSKEKLKMASSLGNYNKEILIVEHQGREKLELLSSNEDIARQYKAIRNAYLQGFIGLSFLLLYSLYHLMMKEISLGYGIVAAITLLILIPLGFSIGNAEKNAKKYSEEAILKE